MSVLENGIVRPRRSNYIRDFLSYHISKMLFGIFLLAFFSIIVVIWYYYDQFSSELWQFSKQHKDWAIFGDYFGGFLNPILGFLALSALLITIVLQISELQVTREELKFSRIAHEKSEVALRKQAITLQEQLEQAKRASNAEYFFRAIDQMQNENTRNARRRVFELYFDVENPTPLSEWSLEDRSTGEIVCQTYDTVGMMVRNGFVEEEIILSSWCSSIVKSWKSTKEIVIDRRKIEGEEFWTNFQWLYERTVKYLNEKK